MAPRRTPLRAAVPRALRAAMLSTSLVPRAGPRDPYSRLRMGIAGGSGGGGMAALVAAGGLAAPVLGKVLDALTGGPLRVVVLERVDQLPHELGRGADPGYDHAWDLVLVDVVVE